MKEQRGIHVGKRRKSYCRRILAFCEEQAVSVPPGFHTTDAYNYAVVDVGNTPHTLIAWDSRAESAAEVARLARMLLDAGCVYFCCWGPGCERVHDVIDEEYSKDGRSVHDNESTIMTTWHDDHPLEESVWFALNVAFPDDRFFDECKSVVAVCIGSTSWATEITTAFESPRALVARVVDGEGNAA